MQDTRTATAPTWRQKRRKLVKNSGRWLTRRLATFLGQQSLVGDTPVIDSALFPHLKTFTDNWEAIRSEVLEILKHRDAIPAFHDVSPDQHKISTGKNWRTFILFGFGEKLEKNCTQAPLTTRLLSDVPNLQTAWFSILSPGYHIRAHRGVSKGILRAHLGLIIPKDAEKCRIRVGDVIKVWRPASFLSLTTPTSTRCGTTLTRNASSCSLISTGPCDSGAAPSATLSCG